MCAWACAALFTFALVMVCSFPLFVEKKKVSFFFVSVRPTNRSEHFLDRRTRRRCKIISMNITSAQGKYSLHFTVFTSHGNVYVRAWVYVFTSQCFLLPFLSLYLSCIISYRFLRFSRCVVSICHLNNYDKQQHIAAFRIGCMLYIFPYYLLFFLFRCCVYTMYIVHGYKDKQIYIQIYIFVRRLYRIILLVCRHCQHRYVRCCWPQHKTVKRPTDYYYLPQMLTLPFFCLVLLLPCPFPYLHTQLPPYACSHSRFSGRWCRLVYYYLADYVFSLLSTSVLTYNNNNMSSSSSSKTNICIIRS